MLYFGFRQVYEKKKINKIGTGYPLLITFLLSIQICILNNFKNKYQSMAISESF